MSVQGPGRSYELDILRRSLAMLTPGVPALRREQALELLDELVEVQHRLDRLKRELRRLVLRDLAREGHHTVLLVTHNSAIARMADRVVRLHSGGSPVRNRWPRRVKRRSWTGEPRPGPEAAP
jgi:ABC-type taurine transport system ATPase subunit